MNNILHSSATSGLFTVLIISVGIGYNLIFGGLQFEYEILAVILVFWITVTTVMFFVQIPLYTAWYYLSRKLSLVIYLISGFLFPSAALYLVYISPVHDNPPLLQSDFNKAIEGILFGSLWGLASVSVAYWDLCRLAKKEQRQTN